MQGFTKKLKAHAHLFQQMPSLHKDGAALFAKWLVQAHMGTSDPRSGGIASVFILKHAIHHKDFLTAIVPVWIEKDLWRPFH
jgi:hypothetical protein